MPTPSSDQPPSPNPSSPQPHALICPEELQASSVHECEDGTDREPTSIHMLGDVENGQDSPALTESIEESLHGGDNISSSSRAGDPATASEGRTSLDLSSRAATMSPRPQSTTTVGTSPASDTLGDEMNKRPGAQVGKRATSGWDGLNPSGRRSPDQLRHAGAQTADVGSASLDDALYAPSMGSHFPSLRTTAASPCSFLRSGSKFVGIQKSERQKYDVEVDIKHVDMRESFLCGFLKITGLTEDHPQLTTYFEGEIIGPKYNFFTNHESWGSKPRTDIQHWEKFTSFKPYKKLAKKGPTSVPNNSQQEHIFMRWKEHFLVPDHRVRTINGASFEGFYYICFNQVNGHIEGIYFHAKSEKFQKLDLKHVSDRGCYSAVEFR